MNFHSSPDMRDAHSKLILQLCDALSAFVAATSVEEGAADEPAPDVSANDNRVPQRAPMMGFDDIISLRGILIEFGLNQPQVMKLRKHYGFPEPVGRARPLMFRRDEVERWVQSQPNQDNLAVTLRSRRRFSRWQK